MDASPLAVQPWPQASLPERRGHDGTPVVFAVATPDSTLRDAARRQVRTAAREVIGTLFGMAPAAVDFDSVPSQPLRLRGSLSRVGLSFSHERGLSLVAVNPAGLVGVDLMRLDGHAQVLHDWPQVAADYLGDAACDRIRSHPPQEQWRAFTEEWTRLEACLKCHGQALEEWSPAVAGLLARCRVQSLALRDGFFGAVACAI